MSYIPPYSYFYNNGRNPYSDGKLLPIAASRRPNPLWRSYGIGGIVLGVSLLILGLTILPLEVARIIAGSLNRQSVGSYLLYPNYNFDLNGNTSLIKAFQPDSEAGNNFDLADSGIVPQSAIASPVGVPVPGNYPIQDKYLWPWSHAALLFSIITMISGIVGILSGCRRTYTAIFAFFILSLLNAFLSIFLIAYFATEVLWESNVNAGRRNLFIFYNIDFALSASILALSCVNLILSFITSAYAGLSAGVCLGSKSPLVRLSDLTRGAAKLETQQASSNPRYISTIGPNAQF